jgi:hypothetical protein
MPQNFTITLAALADYIVPAIVVASVVGSWIHNALKKYGDARKAEMGEGSPELQQMAAQRREQFREAARHRPEISARPGPGSSPDANLSMADRIARARAKAQQAQQTQQTQRPLSPAEQLQDPRIQQAIAQRRAQLRQQQQQQQARQQAQQQVQQQAQRRAQQQAQQRTRQQQAQAHARAQAQARQHGVLLHEPAEPSRQPTRKASRRTPEQPKTTRRSAHESIPEKTATGPAPIGKLSLDDLRKAIVLNEVLGKPVALREEGSF